jgi:hypothetical protein
VADVPTRVRTLIAEKIESVEQLEVLLLLRDAPDRHWTAEEVARALVSRIESVGGWLEQLARDRLIVGRSAVYRFAPATAEDEAAIDDLAQSYAKYRVAVIALIFSTPSDSVRAFSEALPSPQVPVERRFQ